MQLIKVRDNKNRPINNLDVMVGAVFGDKVPREFVQDKYYKAGEKVYAFDSNGKLNIWVCNMNGRFKTCKEPNFSEWSIDSVVAGIGESGTGKGLNDYLFLPEDLRTPMYECKSVIVPRNTYVEDTEHAYFSSSIEGFNIKDYNGENDQLDVYLRREHSDSYLTKKDYKVNGNVISVELPLIEMVDEVTETTCYLPFGRVVTNTDTERYWYSDTDGQVKTTPFTVNGIQLQQFNILQALNRPVEYGYKIQDLKVLSVQAIVKSPLSDQLATPVYRLKEIEIDTHDKISYSINNNLQTIELFVIIDKDQRITDRVLISYQRNSQLVSITSQKGYVHQVKFQVTSRKDKPVSLFMIGSKAVNPMTKFIKTLDEYGEIVTINGEHLVKIPRFDLLKHNSFEFELYVDRIFRSDYEEVVDSNTGELYIKMVNNDGIDWNKSKFLFHIFYSITQMAAIVKTHDQKVVLTDTDAFRIMLTSSFVNRFQWLKMREDSKLIPPEVTVGSKNSAIISDPNYYLQKNQVIKADVFSLLFKDFIERRENSETDICNSESYPVFTDTKSLQIPFLDYDQRKDDFLLFKSGGVLVSAAKWYLKDSRINFYVHENSISGGSYIDFRLLDRDETVRVDNHFFDVNLEDKSIDTRLDLSSAAFYLLFSISGQYISPTKYTVDGSVIRFTDQSNENNQPYYPGYGSRVELIIGKYKKPYSKTLYKMIRITATNKGQKEFAFDESIEYNPTTDNLLIFRQDGLYIGERFYHTDASQGKIIFDDNSDIAAGSYIDILLIRNLSIKVYPDTELEVG